MEGLKTKVGDNEAAKKALDAAGSKVEGVDKEAVKEAVAAKIDQVRRRRRWWQRRGPRGVHAARYLC